MGFELSRVKGPFSAANKAGRVLWAVVWLLLFRPSPRLCYGWRRFLLRCFGARIGQGVGVHNAVRIWAPWNLELGDRSAIGHSVDLYCVARIAIGSNSIVSQYSFLCAGTHDYDQPSFPARCAPIVIGNGVWVAADVFVAPGVTIGDGAVVGARASVFKDVESWTVVGGNPARMIKRRAERD